MFISAAPLPGHWTREGELEVAVLASTTRWIPIYSTSVRHPQMQAIMCNCYMTTHVLAVPLQELAHSACTLAACLHTRAIYGSCGTLQTASICEF